MRLNPASAMRGWVGSLGYCVGATRFQCLGCRDSTFLLDVGATLGLLPPGNQGLLLLAPVGSHFYSLLLYSMGRGTWMHLPRPHHHHPQMFFFFFFLLSNSIMDFFHVFMSSASWPRAATFMAAISWVSLGFGAISNLNPSAFGLSQIADDFLALLRFFFFFNYLRFMSF